MTLFYFFDLFSHFIGMSLRLDFDFDHISSLLNFIWFLVSMVVFNSIAYLSFVKFLFFSFMIFPFLRFLVLLVVVGVFIFQCDTSA